MDWLLRQAQYLPSDIVPVAIWVIGFVLALIVAFGPDLIRDAKPLQKRFWGAVLFLFATFAAAGAQAISRIDDLSQSYDRLSRLVPLAQEYEKLHRNSRNVLLQWSTAELNIEEKELDLGWVDLRTDEAQSQIAKLYFRAIDERAGKPYIIAVNVGSTNFYFGKTPPAEQYRKANKAAFKNGVPVVRYYLFDHTHHILLSNGKNVATTFDDYVKDVVPVAGDTDAVFSVALDITNWSKKNSARDFLWVGLADGAVIAETQLGDDWLPDYARATENEVQLNSGRSYLADIASQVSEDCEVASKISSLSLEQRGKTCVVIPKPDTELSKRGIASKYETGMPEHGSLATAWCIYEDVLDLANVPYTSVCHNVSG